MVYNSARTGNINQISPRRPVIKIIISTWLHTSNLESRNPQHICSRSTAYCCLRSVRWKVFERKQQNPGAAVFTMNTAKDLTLKGTKKRQFLSHDW